MKTLVVYYSRSGRTRSLARRLARELDADLATLHDRQSRAGWRGYQRSLFESVTGRDGDIAWAPDTGGYDLVVVGTPVWCGRLSSPVRAWVRRRRGAMRRVAFFCTMASGGAERAQAELEQLLGRRVRAALALSSGEVARLVDGRPHAAIDRFVASLKAMESQLPPAPVAIAAGEAARLSGRKLGPAHTATMSPQESDP
ncbi:MAG: flavodoxin [Rubrivivax sp.]